MQSTSAEIVGLRTEHARVRPAVWVLLTLGTSACLAAAASPSGGVRARVEVRRFGTHCNGTDDDTSAIRAAAAAVPPDGATLRFPGGTCVVHGTVYLKSHTHVEGHGTTLRAALPFTPDHPRGYALMENAHYTDAAGADVDISVNGMTFDYGDFGPVLVPQGGKHALRLDFVTGATVTNNIFYVRGAEDAVAGLGVRHMRVEHNSAYEFRNCAYDFWYGSSDVRVLDNHAETATSAQVLNFNPERTDGDSSGELAQDLVVKGNNFVVTGSRAAPMQIEPLGPHTVVRQVRVTNNQFTNVYLVLRGDVRDAVITANTFSSIQGGPSAIESYPHYGATPDSLTISGNLVRNARTAASELGVIRIEAAHSTVSSNQVTGSAGAAPGVYRGTVGEH